MSYETFFKEVVSKNKRRGFQEVSPERRGFWHGVMAAKLREQEKANGFDGFYMCECDRLGCSGDEIESFEEARRHFQPGHLVARSDPKWKGHRGFKFRGRDLGPDDPTNIVPVHPECNERDFWERHHA